MRAALVASLLLVGTLVTGCGSGSKSSISTPVVASTPSSTTPSLPPSTPSTVSAAAANDLASIDAQLENLDHELGQADTGLSSQEGDPTK